MYSSSWAKNIHPGALERVQLERWWIALLYWSLGLFSHFDFPVLSVTSLKSLAISHSTKFGRICSTFVNDSTFLNIFSEAQLCRTISDWIGNRLSPPRGIQPPKIYWLFSFVLESSCRRKLQDCLRSFSNFDFAPCDGFFDEYCCCSYSNFDVRNFLQRGSLCHCWSIEYGMCLIWSFRWPSPRNSTYAQRHKAILSPGDLSYIHCHIFSLLVLSINMLVCNPIFAVSFLSLWLKARFKKNSRWLPTKDSKISTFNQSLNLDPIAARLQNCDLRGVIWCLTFVLFLYFVFKR